MATKEPPTQDQASNVDEGQQGKGSPLEERLKKLETEMQASQEDKKQAQEDKKKAEADTRKKQAELDREKANRLLAPKPATQPTRPNIPGQLPPQMNPAQQRLQEIDAAAKEAAKEALLYKELLRRGLTEEDVADVIFETPAELKTALDMVEIRKENERLRKEIEDAKTTPPPKTKTGTETDLEVDTGGTSGQRAPDGNSQKIMTLREEAKKAGRTELGRWKLLEAIHADPSKIVSRTPPNEINE